MFLVSCVSISSYYIALYLLDRPHILENQVVEFAEKAILTLTFKINYFLIFFLGFQCFFSHYHLVPLYPTPCHNHHTVVQVHDSFCPFCSSPPSPPLPHFCIHAALCLESVSILLVSSVCSLDSTYE